MLAIVFIGITDHISLNCRDLAIRNVLINDYYDVKITGTSLTYFDFKCTDFGLARHVEEGQYFHAITADSFLPLKLLGKIDAICY